MWRIEPESKLAVSVKRNPGMQTHEQCRNHGYTTVAGRQIGTPSKLRSGDLHTFRAELDAGKLTLIADGQLAWEGSVGVAATELEGPSGLRTDNAHVEFEYFTSFDNTASGSKAIQGAPRHCRPSPGD